MKAGDEIGAYRIIEQIGQGGMGEVWLAEHSMLGRRAAIKVLHAAYSMRAEIVTRFFNEARAATAIPDPGIVSVFDFGQDATGSAYIVMELLDGETLDRRLRRLGPLAPSDALRLMRQVASTLGAAHARGIIHRDLKPENIFIVRDPEVSGGERAKILDFGIAKLVGEQAIKTQTSAVMGTPTFMSPEQCRGAGQVDQRSDVYSLGCVLFVVLVGRPPFDGEGVGDIIVSHMREPPPVPSRLRPDLSPAIDELVLRCLAKDPGHRFGSAGELAAAIEAIGKQVAAPAVVVTSRVMAKAAMPTTLSSLAGPTNPPPVEPRSRVIAIGLVAAIGAIAIIATVAIARRGSEPAEVASAATAMTASLSIDASSAAAIADAAPRPDPVPQDRTPKAPVEVPVDASVDAHAPVDAPPHARTAARSTVAPVVIVDAGVIHEAEPSPTTIEEPPRPPVADDKPAAAPHGTKWGQLQHDKTSTAAELERRTVQCQTAAAAGSCNVARGVAATIGTGTASHAGDGAAATYRQRCADAIAACERRQGGN